MEQNDLIKKLESIKTPIIRIQAHKRNLKFALLNSDHFQRKTKAFSLKRFIPIGAVAALVMIFVFSSARVTWNEAKAMTIAKNDPKIQQLMKNQGAVISDVKIKDGKAYVLLSLSKDNASLLMSNGSSTNANISSSSDEIGIENDENGEPESLNSSVAEIDLDNKQVNNIQSHKTPIPALSQEEKSQAVEIVKADSQIKALNIDFTNAEIKVKPLPPFKLHIDNDNNGEHSGITISGSTQDKRAIVDINSNGSEYKIVINLTQKKVEQVINNSESENNGSEKGNDHQDQAATGTDSSINGERHGSDKSASNKKGNDD